MRIKPGMEATLPCEPELGPLYLTERVELTGLQENPERNALRGTALEWVRCAHAQTLRPTRQRLACHPVLPGSWRERATTSASSNGRNSLVWRLLLSSQWPHPCHPWSL